MNIVLTSTYELGRQPFGVVSPAAWLRKRGHMVTCFDLTRQSLDPDAIASAELIALYLPMHTATRLAAQLIPELRRQNPRAHLCCYGLYAPMNVELLQLLGVRTLLGGEFESGLANLAEQLSAASQPGALPSQDGTPAQGQTQPLISLERLAFEVPDRSGLPPIEKYAHLLIPGDGFRLVGSTEASRGCKHLCRHCPIVPVYKGVFRIVQRDVVLEDIRRQVAAGAQHISFGDPDFFNGIGHALEIIKRFHEEFPGITYDVTIKIEHLKKYSRHLATLRDTGCLFVISAVESVDNAFLQILDKGHTREDFLGVVKMFRELGMTLHPTFVPFSPWTTMENFFVVNNMLQDDKVFHSGPWRERHKGRVQRHAQFSEHFDHAQKIFTGMALVEDLQKRVVHGFHRANDEQTARVAQPCEVPRIFFQMLDFYGDVVSDAGNLFVKSLYNFQRMTDTVKKIGVAKRDVLRPSSHLTANVLQHHIALHNAEDAFINRNDRAMPAQMFAATAGLRRAHQAKTVTGNQQVRVFFDGRQPAAIRNFERQSLKGN